MIFAVEVVLKVLSMGFIVDKRSYLRDTWNIFDFIIIFTSLLDLSTTSVNIPAIKVKFIL